MPFETNNDPLKRWILMTAVSTKASVASAASFACLTLDEALKLFPKSNALENFFGDPAFINNVMVMMLYCDDITIRSQKDARRRIVISPMPDDEDGMNELLRATAASLGVTLKTHEIKIESGITALNRPGQKTKSKSVKESAEFLCNLVEFYTGDLRRPDAQLNELKELFLQMSIHEGEIATQALTIGAFLQGYINNKDNYFRVATKFGGHLAKADLKLSTSLLEPTVFAYLFELPFRYEFSNFYLKSAFIKISVFDEKVITIVAPKYINGQWDGTYFYSTVNIDDSDCLDRTLKETAKFFYDQEIVQINDVVKYKDFVAFLLKNLIFISSKDADLTPEKGQTTSKKNPTKIRDYYRRHCPFEITNIGYGFHGRHYTGDEFEVRGHFRWQPCGTERLEVKLIWIDEYVKNKKPKEIV